MRATKKEKNKRSVVVLANAFITYFFEQQQQQHKYMCGWMALRKNIAKQRAKRGMNEMMNMCFAIVCIYLFRDLFIMHAKGTSS